MSNDNGPARESVATWPAPPWASHTIEDDGVLYHERHASQHVTSGLGDDATPVLRSGDLPEVEGGTVTVTRSEPVIVLPVEGGELVFTTEQARALAAAVAELAGLADDEKGYGIVHTPAAPLAQVMAFGGGVA